MPTHQEILCLPGKRSLLSSLMVTASMVAGLCWAPISHASIISTPASIVDHGSYITDTANHLDWYRFSNAVNTVGESMNGWLASNQLVGWSVASASQVQGLEAQFGWTGDTPNDDANANEGLTTAMSGFLGATTNVLSHGTNTLFIQAMTSDMFMAWNDATQQTDILLHQVTTSQFVTEWFILDGQNNFVDYGDHVDASYRLQGLDETDYATGIWLSRATQSVVDVDVPSCGTLAPCIPDNTVPEPASALLVLTGLGTVGMVRRRRRA